jgi:hypothetical protein
MILPAIHLNGSDPRRMWLDVVDALGALRGAQEALAAVGPNGRDYYPLGDGALGTALREHEQRQAALAQVMADLEQLSEHLCDQMDERGIPVPSSREDL